MLKINGTKIIDDSRNLVNTGNVGIAVVDPLGKLHVRAADECNFVVREESTSLVLSAETNSGRDNNRLMTLEGNGLVFNSGGTERLRVTSGDVGIGTATPTDPAHALNTAKLSVGIVTANEYFGDGSNLSGISVGLTTEALVTSGIVTTLNLTDAQDHKVTATGICTITVTGGTEADSHTVRIINSGIATVGFSTFFLFPSGATPNLPTADGAISLISFTVNRVGAGGTQLLAGASVNYS